MDEKTTFRLLFGEAAQVKVLDFLLDNKDFDYSLTEIARNAGVGWSTIHGFWKTFQILGIVKETRRIGRATMFKLNTKNPVIKKLIDFELELSNLGVELELKRQELAGKNPVKMLDK